MLRNALFAVTVGTLATVGAANAQESAAAKAIEAAKQFAGTTITVTAEAGLQALLDKQFTGPEWEQLTGVKVNVVELPNEEIYPKTILEHQAGTGAYDAVLMSPAWLADLVANGAIVPLDPYIEKYGVKSEFDDINPAFKDWMSYEGKIYGLVVDGDVLVTYYRTDLFADPENQSRIQGQIRLRSRPTQELSAVRRYRLFSDREVSAGHVRRWGDQHGLHVLFLQRALPRRGGKVFRSGNDEGDGELRCRRQSAD